MRLSISPLAAATLISLALIVEAPRAIVAYSEFVGFGQPASFDPCSVKPIACDTDSDCEEKNPHLVDCEAGAWQPIARSAP
jgi:hypothetical protein